MFFFNDTATTEIYTLSLHDALPISLLESIDEVATDALTWGNERGREHAAELAARLRDVSATMGLEEIPVRDGAVNEDEHEIIAHVGASQRFPEGSIVEVRQRGYRLNGRVMRRAQIVVAGRARPAEAPAA